MDPAALSRVVTGVDGAGRSIVASAGGLPTILRSGGGWIAEAWVADALPAVLDDERDLAAGRWHVDAPPGGMAFRIAQFAPAGEPGSSSETHATSTLDYAIILSGRVWLVLDEGEVEVSAGDCVVQRGTTHRWENREAEPCVMAAVLVAAAPR